MRRILITPRIEDIAKRYAKKMEDCNTFSGMGPKERLLILSNDLKKASASIRIKKQKKKNDRKTPFSRKKGNEMTILSDYVKAIYDNYDGIILIDPHAAHERINYEKIKSLAEKSKHVQKLLTPILLTYACNSVIL